MTDSNGEVLSQGIPSLKSYEQLLKTDLFLEMEAFSNSFLKSHAEALRDYSRRPDSFRQWSRQWEYPFAYSYIRRFCSLTKLVHSSRSIRILDAGSGCTFFPYYISHKHHNCMMYCCDWDSSLTSIFGEINRRRDASVEFNVYDLSEMGYEDNFFDAIFCISVLEHAQNSVNIIRQFKRVLKPGGLLVITFDISLDGETMITVEAAKEMLRELCSSFKPETPHIFQVLQRDLQCPAILTTEFAKRFDKRLLPWKLTWRSALMQLRSCKLPREQFSNLTVFCGVWQKAKQATL